MRWGGLGEERRRSPQNRMIQLVTRHWELKLLALVFSAGPWVVVTGEKPDNVEVQLHGLRSTLSRVSPESLRVKVSLVGARPGDVVVSLGPEQIVVPPGVSVLRVNPGFVRLMLARER